MITITGHSDDLVEVDGDIVEEFDAYDGTHLTLSDGTVLKADFSEEGIWWFSIVRAGSATIKIERVQVNGTDEDGGSRTDKVTVSSPIEWVRQGIHEVPGAGEIPETFTDNVVVDENATDGYHSFRELYEYRLLYNAALFNEWAELAFQRRKQWAVDADLHKSRRHSDGELAFGGGWFVVVAQLPTGQISNHYPEEAWGLFRIPERETAAEWDGHTPADVAERLRAFLTAGLS